MMVDAGFEGEVKLPVDQRTQYFWEPGDRLPRDGLPRITAEGVKLLAEGLRGDFSGWRWAIGNHPLELPSEHVSNFQVRAMKDRPHFLAKFWYGDTFPAVKYHVLTPSYAFDMLDTMTVWDEPATCIHLRSRSDPWAYCPVVVDDNLLWTEAEHGRFKGTSGPVQDDGEDEDDTEDDAPVRGPAQGTLDAWMGGSA